MWRIIVRRAVRMGITKGSTCHTCVQAANACAAAGSGRVAGVAP